jgi:hypothetical protein
MAVHFKQVAIIGVGLIGGSLGMILRRKRLADEVVGVGRRVENLKAAVELGAIDRYVADPKDGVRHADLIVLATPVDTYERHLRDWAQCLPSGAASRGGWWSGPKRRCRRGCILSAPIRSPARKKPAWLPEARSCS